MSQLPDDHPTFVLRSMGVAVHCRHPLLAVAPSLNPPRRLAARLSADIANSYCPKELLPTRWKDTTVLL